MSLEAAHLGPYKILLSLGAGGMGEVYLAEDTRLHRKVALKLIEPRAAADEEAQRRFLREARAAAALDHPNICTLYEIGSDEGRDYLVMQYVKGVTLDRLLRQKQPSVAEALRIAIELAEALAYAHGHGIVHRDIKPQNVMISPEGRVHLMDFGLARSKELDRQLGLTTEALTMTGALLGTAQFMAPEQLRGRIADVRSDIFSLGLVLHFLFTGKHPFQDESPTATLSAILTRELPPVPPIDGIQLDPVVRKALAKDPAERYQTVNELLGDLRRLVGASRTEQADTHPHAPKQPAPRSSGRLLWAAGLVAGMLFVGAGLLWRPWREPSAAAAAVPQMHTLTYRLEVERGQASRSGTDARTLHSGDRVRLNVHPGEPGMLYVVDDSYRHDGVSPSLAVVYAAAAPVGQAPDELRTDWLVFDRHAGVEKLWFVWSKQAIAQLEPLRELINERDMGIVRNPTTADAVRQFLNAKAAKDLEHVGRDTNQATVRYQGDTLVQVLELEHR